MTISVWDIIDQAKKALGTDYLWGGTGTKEQGGRFDCSGLVQNAFASQGIQLPRTTYQQIGVGAKVSFNNLQPGDMVFFDTQPGTAGPDHVGLYIGDGKMIHAPRTGSKVQITSITSNYYKDIFMGARRVKGTSTMGLKTYDGPEGAPDLSEEELAATYGWASSFLKGNSELNAVFKEAVKGQWSPDMFQAKIRNTGWWKKTSDTARQLELQKATDPATYRATREATEIAVKQMAAQIGAAIPKKSMSKIVDSVLKTGMEEDGLRNVLGNYIKFSKDQTVKGEAGMHAANIREYAYNMGVNLSDDAVANYAVNIVKKMGTDEDYKEFIKQQAISAFPGYGEDIMGGASVLDLADPYMQQMAQTWGVPLSSISIKDPMIRQAMNGLGRDGQPRGLTQSDFGALLRKDPRYSATSQAIGETMKVGSSVLKNLGLM